MISYPSLLAIHRQVLAELPSDTPSEIALAVASVVQAAHEDWDDWLSRPGPMTPKVSVRPLNPAEFDSPTLLASQYLIQLKLKGTK